MTIYTAAKINTTLWVFCSIWSSSAGPSHGVQGEVKGESSVLSSPSVPLTCVLSIPVSKARLWVRSNTWTLLELRIKDSSCCRFVSLWFHEQLKWKHLRGRKGSLKLHRIHGGGTMLSGDICNLDLWALRKCFTPSAAFNLIIVVLGIV